MLGSANAGKAGEAQKVSMKACSTSARKLTKLGNNILVVLGPQSQL